MRVWVATGEFCEPRVKRIIARETKQAETAVEGRPWPASSFLSRRWLSDDEKTALRNT
eukprot:m.134782 g.134782  ORF g.134782 m.134782 type:complete len:58 (+) comp11399_c0_seq4:476-649(+)